MTEIFKSRLKCGVLSCEHKSGMEFSLHKLPRKDTDRKRYKRWLHILKLNERKLTKKFVVCSNHFLDNEFHQVKSPNKWRRLKMSAVPSRNLPGALVTPDIEKHSGFQEQLINSDENTNLVIEPKPTNFPFATELFQLYQEQIASQQTQVNFLHRFIDYQNYLIGEKDSQIKTLQEDLVLQQNLCKHLQQQNELKIISQTSNEINNLKKQNETKKSPPTTSNSSIQCNTMHDFLPLKPSITEFINSDIYLKMWTGISNYKLLDAIVENVGIYDPEQTSKYKISLRDRILLFFIKLKTGLTFCCIASLFFISNTTCSKYFYDLISVLRATLNFAVFWPPKSIIEANMPKCFQPHFVDTVAVLDCTEITIKSFGCLNCKTDTYSNYKGRNTVKFLIAVSPDGMITHVSKGYPGRTSDKFTFNNENLIQKCVSLRDAIMVDKGFAIEQEAKEHGVKLYRPPFLKRSIQLSAPETEENYQIAAARVHIERANQRIKCFSIFKTELDSNILCVVDDLMFIICAIVNLSPPIIGDDHFEY